MVRSNRPLAAWAMALSVAIVTGGLSPSRAVTQSARAEVGDTAALLFAYDATAPLDVEELARESFDGGTRIDLTFESPDGGRVPAFVYEPVGSGPHPAIVFAHGMPGNRRSLASLAMAYVRTGAVVIAITGPYSRPDPVYRPAATFLTIPLFDERDRLEFVQFVKDLRRAVDYLTENANVDANEIGFVGHSYGGMVGAVLSGVERRIRAYAIMTAPPGLPYVFRSDGQNRGLLGLRTIKEQTAWLEAMAPIDATRFVRDAAPAALLFQIAHNDRLVRRAYAEALAAAASEPKMVSYYDADHELVPEAFRDQAVWLSRWLGINVSAFIPPDLRRASHRR